MLWWEGNRKTNSGGDKTGLEVISDVRRQLIGEERVTERDGERKKCTESYQRIKMKSILMMKRRGMEPGQEKRKAQRVYQDARLGIEIGRWTGWFCHQSNKDIEHLNNTTNDLDLISICRTSHSKK